MQLTLSQVFAAIEAGHAKKEIREMFALSAKQYKTLINTPAVAAKFEAVKAAKQAAIDAEKAAKRAEKDLVIVDDIANVAEPVADLAEVTHDDNFLAKTQSMTPSFV
jgi:hypothetical protein